MADERLPSTAEAGDLTRDERPRGGRPQGGRDSGGFRIRLSDNEMQAARALQEAFGLRSTVAVLGFSLRAMAQQLEQGQLDELIRQQRAQAGPRGGGEGIERRGERPERRGEGRRDGGRSGGGPGGGGSGGGRVDPFARPSRPAAATEAETMAHPEAAAEPEQVAPEPADGSDPVSDESVVIEPAAEAAAAPET